MNRDSTAILLVGGVLLFLTLAALFALQGEYAGRATMGTTVNVSNSTPANCSVTAYPGLNTVSFPCITTAEPAADVLTGADLWAAYQYVPGTSDQWKVHNPNLPGYVVSDLQYLSRRAGYAMVMNSSRTYVVEGFQVPFTNVPLIAGWNLVGYPAFVTRNVSDSLSDIDNYTEVRTYDNGTYLSHVNPSGGTLAVTGPGKGYWINATQAATWTVIS